MNLKKAGLDGMVYRTRQVVERAHWFAGLLAKNGYDAWANDHAPCVILPAPSKELLIKYHLPLYKSADGDFTHIFTMEHVCEKALEKFLEEYLMDSLETVESMGFNYVI